jgi:hypothetical protein
MMSFVGQPTRVACQVYFFVTDEYVHLNVPLVLFKDVFAHVSPALTDGAANVAIGNETDNASATAVINRTEWRRTIEPSRLKIFILIFPFIVVDF